MNCLGTGSANILIYLTILVLSTLIVMLPGPYIFNERRQGLLMSETFVILNRAHIFRLQLIQFGESGILCISFILNNHR
jgi:hypothetical protein